MENLLFLGVPILKHIRVTKVFFHTSVSGAVPTSEYVNFIDSCNQFYHHVPAADKTSSDVYWAIE